jgi:YVTN family beta-propeller protein
MRARLRRPKCPTSAARRRRAIRVALTASCAAGGLLAAVCPAQAATAYTAYVANWSAGTVSPINTATNVVDSAITVGTNPAGIAITPDGKTAYVANYGSNTVTPIDTAANIAGGAITVGTGPAWIAITPDGKTAYVANYGSNTVIPIDTATNTAGTAIAVGSAPVGIAISPDGKTVYVANSHANTVTPIDTATNTAGTAIAVGSAPIGIAISPDGKTVYVANSGANTVTPIDTATNTAGTAIAAGSAPIGIAISPDGASAYVADSGFDTITPITVATNTTRTPITVGNGPWGIAITPDGASAYVANLGNAGFSGNTTSGSTLVSGISSTARLSQGMTVTGAGIPEGTIIAAPPGPNSITLSKAATASATGVALTAWEPTTVTPINLVTQTATTPISVATSVDAEPAIVPDQAPVASFTVTAAATGSPSSFDASASTVAYGTITSYEWNFGDGVTATTSTPTTTHTYAAASTYTVTLTETDSAGTSTTQVFTGQTMSRNGGPSAQSTRSVSVAAPPPIASTSTGPLSNSLPALADPSALAPTPVVISVLSVSITRRGDAWIPLSCPATAQGGCRGTITLRLANPHRARRARAVAARCARGCRALGSSNYEARAGQKTRIRVHIASFGRRLLAQRKSARVTLTATSVSAGHTASAVRTITLRAPARAA